ncbi:hypothetical protein [Polynucleobacter sp. UK-Kesae-W10]|uniref:hypothetical protein n=1 Tax=Polynucleobacter sp. UK-Kesae-W10 TaxID=1819738 RepID=UPI001C0AE15A|nr:hypothetical protein [Polynucleobacter sp. UK-Kesae-W10]MBU3577660.1 hypothetical protein [Polynucleobacter sp. UK-Kesae-W10]
MNKFSTNLVVAIAAFLFGLASASALGEAGLHGKSSVTSNAMTDAMGNICATQD